MNSADPSAAPPASASRTNPIDTLDRWILRGWRTFKSIKFGLFLLSLIGIACMYGTVFYAANSTLGTSAIPLAKARVFYAPWFIALLALFFVQFVISTWHVTKMSVLLWWKKDFSKSMTFFTQGRHGRAAVEVPGGPDEVERVLRERFTRSHREGNRFFAHRGLRQRIGPTIIHAGIVVVLIAGLVRITMDRQGMILAEGRFIAEEGETSNLIWAPVFEDHAFGPGNARAIPIPYEITVLDFDEVLHPNSNQPAEYFSLLRVRSVETGKVQVVRVDMNHNLRIGGYKFHQASFQALPLEETWRIDFDVRDARTGERIAVTDTNPGLRVQVGNEDLFLEVDGETAGSPWRLYTSKSPRRPVAEGVLTAPRGTSEFRIEPKTFYPDFTISRETGPRTLSNEPRNPALEVLMTVDGVPLGRTLLLMDEELAESLPTGNDFFRLQLLDVHVHVRADAPRDLAEIDWNDPTQARFEVEVRDILTNEVAATHLTAMNTASDPIQLQLDEEPGTDPASSGAYVVSPLGPTTRYITVLSVVKEPIVPYYTLGSLLIFFGALITFSGRYRALYALWDEEANKLHLALVPRFGKEPDPEEFAGLLEALGAPGDSPGSQASTTTAGSATAPAGT